MDFKKEIIVRAIDLLMDMGRRVYIRAIVNDDVMVPASAIIDGFTTLNITSGAVQLFKFQEKHLEFNATFGGRPYTCVVPYATIGMVFCPDDQSLGVSIPIELVVPEITVATHTHSEQSTGDKTEPPEKKGSHLKVIK